MCQNLFVVTMPTHSTKFNKNKKKEDKLKKDLEAVKDDLEQE